MIAGVTGGGICVGLIALALHVRPPLFGVVVLAAFLVALAQQTLP